MSGFAIRNDSCALDFLSLGALVNRLDPGVIPFRKARSVEIHVSGGEYNVAANLSDCFGLRTGIATAMVDYGIGELVQTRLRETGVTPFFKWFEHDGVRGPNIATVYSDRGHGVRAPVVFYNRANEAGAMLKAGDFDWPKMFARGVRWFHSGGIAGPQVESTKSKLDPDAFFTLIERVVAQHPNIKLVATTLREVHSTNRHDWAAVLWLDGQRLVSPTCQLDVNDRIGGGDGFAAGLIYGLLA